MAMSPGGRHVFLGVILLALGFVSIMSIGLAIITIGLAHLALYPVRHRRDIVLPVMAGVVAFWVGFALVAPMTCTGGTVREGQCVSLAGITYPYENPTFLPGLAAAVLLGAATAFALHLVERARSRRSQR